MKRNCDYCELEYIYLLPTSKFCSPNCRIKHHKLSKDFIRKPGSEVRGKKYLRHYKLVYKKIGIGTNCIRWIKQSSGWYNMWWRKDCKIKGSDDVQKNCNDCSHFGHSKRS